ncbi:Replication-associated recombination protein A [compost metagenome]
MQIANEAALTYERLGSPEGELTLGQAVFYLAIAAKNNAGYNAFNQAMAFVSRTDPESFLFIFAMHQPSL